MEATGILSPTSKFLRSASVAFLPLCGGDGWIGNTERFGMQFRGAQVVQATLSDLVSRGLGRHHQQHLLLFGGASAGARGAMVHLDYVRGMLGDAAQQVDVVGVFDSFVIEDSEPMRTSSEPAFRDQFRHFMSFANVSHLGTGCSGEWGQGSESWRCIMGVYRLPTITTPYLLMATQYDRFQLGNNIGRAIPTDVASVAYAEHWAARYQQLSRVLASHKGRAVMSWACYNHAISLSDDGFRGVNVHGVSMQDALVEFVWNRTSADDDAPLHAPVVAYDQSLLWLDTCRTFDCGAGCHAKTGTSAGSAQKNSISASALLPQTLPHRL